MLAGLVPSGGPGGDPSSGLSQGQKWSSFRFFLLTLSSAPGNGHISFCDCPVSLFVLNPGTIINIFPNFEAT